jgi:biopolymer transport protein ExbD
MTRSRISFNHQKVFEEPVINLTPLIDVVFVILIMFIIVAPLLEMDQIELADNGQDPLGNSTQVQETSPIAIHVRADNTILFNNQPINVDQLAEALRTARERYPKAVPQLFHDRKAHFGLYQQVKNASGLAGFTQLDIILKPA